MTDEDGKTDGDNVLFAIFIFAVLMITLVPLTLWRVCSGSGEAAGVVQPWQKGQSKPSALRRRFNHFNVALILAWCALVALGMYISSCTLKEDETFDPFAILDIPMTADAKVIKKAYNKMARKYHPDKVSDPELKREYTLIFSEKISKAYQTLTDDGARENWIKHGHPDGQQAMTIGIALPSFFFTKDKAIAPIVLLVLAFCGLALPILGMALYLYRSEGFVGAHKVSQQTITYYTRFGVKEMLRVPKMAEALVPAEELVTMPIKRQTAPALRQYLTRMRKQHESLSSLPKWWTPEMLRAHIFLLSHLSRTTDEVPEALRPDLNETLRLAPILCDEFVKAAASARNRMLRGWFLPAEAAVHMQQCTLQQVKPEIRSAGPDDGKKKKKGVNGEAAAALMQLPGIEEETVRQLGSQGVKRVEDLVKLEDEKRTSVLESCGVDAASLPLLQKTLLSLPHAHITAVKAFVDGEEDMKEQDMLTVQIFVAITRGAHVGAAAPPPSRAAVQAHTPRYPHVATEKWHVLLSNQKVSTPSTWAYKAVELESADAAGAGHLSELGCRWAGLSGSGEPSKDDDEPAGQKVEFKLMLPEPGRFNLTVVVMPSCWLGCDVTAPLALNVLKQTAEEKEGKGPVRGAAAKKALQDDDDDTDDDDVDGDGDGDESDGWDTEETGTDVTHFSDDEASGAAVVPAASDKDKAVVREPKKKK